MTWQNTPSLSDGNKVFIYCAGAGNAAFSWAYASWSGLGACSPPSLPPSIFANNASLRTAAQEFNADAASATAIYGPISSWDISAITSMYQLFYNLGDFNANISAWNTSGVTDMSDMFRSASAFNQPLSLDTSSVTTMRLLFYASAFNQPLSFDTSSVTAMGFMFSVRSARALPPPALSRSLPVHAACTAVAPRPLTARRMCPLFDSAERKLPVRR